MKGKCIQNGEKSEHSQYQGWHLSAIRKSIGFLDIENSWGFRELDFITEDEIL